jgi:hypothetical protein
MAEARQAMLDGILSDIQAAQYNRAVLLIARFLSDHEDAAEAGLVALLGAKATLQMLPSSLPRAMACVEYARRALQLTSNLRPVALHALALGQSAAAFASAFCVMFVLVETTDIALSTWPC